MKISLKTLWCSVLVLVAATSYAIIPQPKSIENGKGEFVVTSATPITFNAEELRPLAAYMLDYLDVKVVTNKAVPTPAIAVELHQGVEAEGYKLLDWLEATGRSYPIRIHSANPVARERMRAIIRRNGWEEVK